MNILKIHLHVEQLLLKTTWRLVERLVYNQTEKKDLHRIRQKGRKNNQVRTWEGTLRGDLEEEGDCTGKYLPWGVRGFSHILDTPDLGCDTRKMSPPGWFENQWN